MKSLKVMANLGVLISGAEEQVILPERALVESFLIAKEDYKALRLIHTWVQKYHDLIHVEALVSILKEYQGSGICRLMAGSLRATKEKRFDRIFKMAKKDGAPNLAPVISFAAEIGQCKPDPNFAEFGLRVSDIELEADRKFRPKKYLLVSNVFFFCRTLFGVNWRADVAACFFLKRADSPTQVSKFLNCSYDAAHRNFNDLAAAGWNREAFDFFSISTKRQKGVKA